MEENSGSFSLRNPGSRTFLLWNLKPSGLWNPEYSFSIRNIQNLTNDWNPESKVQLTKNPESSTWNAESMAWNPEPVTVLDSLTWGELINCILADGSLLILGNAVINPSPGCTVCFPSAGHETVTRKRGTWGFTVLRYWAFFHALFR